MKSSFNPDLNALILFNFKLDGSHPGKVALWVYLYKNTLPQCHQPVYFPLCLCDFVSKGVTVTLK